VLIELGFDEDYIMAEMVANMDYGLEHYRNARKLLIELGYTEKELVGVRTTSAWDYGRTAVIARRSVHLGYIKEHEAWEFMKAAAENAEQVYSGWRDYLAGYVLGRAIGYGNDSRDMVVELKYLLNSRYSPLREIVF